MSTRSPSCDPRSFEDLVRDTEALAKAYSGYVPQPASSPDMGFALVRVFAKMAAAAVERLNRVPDRSFLAYLDMLGVEPAPARPAKVPLTFQLVPTGSASPLIPAGTRVGAQPAPGDKEEVIFETSEDLATTRSALVAAVVHDPISDRFAEVTPGALGRSATIFPAFLGDTPIEHSLFIPASEVLSLAKGTPIILRLQVADASRWLDLSTKPSGSPAIEWTLSGGDALTWLPLPDLRLSIDSGVLTLSFTAPGPTAPLVLNGQRAQFVRARASAFAAGALPAISSVTLRATLDASGRSADIAFFNDTAVDIGKDFLPLGERPRFNDTFYLASREVLGCAGGAVTLDFTMSDGYAGPKDTDTPTLVWEVATSSGWREIGRSTKTTTSGTGFSDTTLALSAKAGGRVSFSLPSDISPATVKGVESAWLRVRLLAGTYGLGLVIRSGVPTDDGYRPPILKSIKLAVTKPVSVNVATMVTRDDFSWAEASLRAPVTPFTPSVEVRPALYLGFDAPFENRTVSLYVHVDPLSAEALLNGASDDAAEVVWEYRSPAGWVSLSASDGTGNLTRSGLVCFTGPRDLVPQRLFGRERCWLRGRWSRGSFAAIPRIGQVVTNTTWAVHTAGGARGNRKSNTITSLKTAIPYVDKVSNREPSTGGADPSSEGETISRGPRSFRHSYRAVAAEDFEDLAREASADVVRARALTPEFDPIAQATVPGGVSAAGKVGVIIVAAGEQRIPSPSAGLIEDVQAYLEARCSPTVALRVSGPDWIQASVALRVVPVSALGGDALRGAILAALDRYLHPLSGQGGQGWDFGHLPAKSDFYPLLAGIPGLGYIRSLTLSFTRPGDLPVEGATSPVGPLFDSDKAGDALGRVLVFSGAHSVEILAPEEA